MPICRSFIGLAKQKKPSKLRSTSSTAASANQVTRFTMKLCCLLVFVCLNHCCHHTWNSSWISKDYTANFFWWIFHKTSSSHDPWGKDPWNVHGNLNFSKPFPWSPWSFCWFWLNTQVGFVRVMRVARALRGIRVMRLLRFVHALRSWGYDGWIRGRMGRWEDKQIWMEKLWYNWSTLCHFCHVLTSWQPAIWGMVV